MLYVVSTFEPADFFFLGGPPGPACEASRRPSPASLPTGAPALYPTRRRGASPGTFGDPAGSITRELVAALAGRLRLGGLRARAPRSARARVFHVASRLLCIAERRANGVYRVSCVRGTLRECCVAPRYGKTRFFKQNRGFCLQLRVLERECRRARAERVLRRNEPPPPGPANRARAPRTACIGARAAPELTAEWPAETRRCSSASAPAPPCISAWFRSI